MTCWPSISISLETRSANHRFVRRTALAAFPPGQSPRTTHTVSGGMFSTGPIIGARDEEATKAAMAKILRDWADMLCPMRV